MAKTTFKHLLSALVLLFVTGQVDAAGVASKAQKSAATSKTKAPATKPKALKTTVAIMPTQYTTYQEAADGIKNSYIAAASVNTPLGIFKKSSKNSDKNAINYFYVGQVYGQGTCDSNVKGTKFTGIIGKGSGGLGVQTATCTMSTVPKGYKAQ